MSDRNERRASRRLWLCSACYALVMGLVVWSMFCARRWALVELATPQSVGDWQAWREEVVESQQRPGPVQRRIPKSNEPPALVLLRDYFAVLLSGAVLFSSLLYWVIAWMVMGALASRSGGQMKNPTAVNRR